MDGIDIALLETDGQSEVRRGPSSFVPYDTAFRRKIETGLEDAKSIKTRAERPGALAAIEKELTKRHAEVVLKFLSEHKIDKEDTDIIGFHGKPFYTVPSKV